jgi:hypothetical protein
VNVATAIQKWVHSACNAALLCLTHCLPLASVAQRCILLHPADKRATFRPCLQVVCDRQQLCSSRCHAHCRMQASTDRFAAPTSSSFTLHGRTCLGMPDKPSRAHVRHAFEAQKAFENDRLEHPKRCVPVHSHRLAHACTAFCTSQHCKCSAIIIEQPLAGTLRRPTANGTRRSIRIWPVCSNKPACWKVHECAASCLVYCP